MQKKQLKIQNKHGLHARAAMRFVTTAARFQSHITVGFHHRQADGKSIMEMMVIGASYGHKIELCICGDDEKEAMNALESLVADRFGENQ